MAGPLHKWTVRELTLKLRECARVPTSSLSFGEYVHGGFSSLGACQALVLLPDPSLDDREVDAVKQAAEHVGADVHSLGVPGPAHTIGDVIPMTVLSHRLAYRTARRRRTHPDTLGADEPRKRDAWRLIRQALTTD